MPKIISFFKNILFLLILFLISLHPNLANSQEEGQISIQFEDSRLSVDIQGAKWSDVIAQLKEVAEIDIQFDSLPEEELVDLKFDNLPLQEGVEQFFPNNSVTLESADSLESIQVNEGFAEPTKNLSSFPGLFATVQTQPLTTTNASGEASSTSAPTPSRPSSQVVVKQNTVSSAPKTKSSPPSTQAAVTQSKTSSASKTTSSPPSAQVAVPQNKTSSTPVPVVTFSDIAAFGSTSSKAQSAANLTFSAVLFPPGNNKTAAPLTVAEINTIVTQAANSLNSSTMVIAVVDRQGTILGLFRKAGGLVANQNTAIALARTAAFFSHNQAVLTSRTVRFISGEHFPPSISFTPNGALFGIEHNNRGCDLNVTYLGGQSFPQSLAAAGGTCANTDQTGCGSGTMTIPGSFPLYKGNTLVGGIGVFGIGPALTNDPQGGLRKLGTGYEAEEFAAIQGAVGFEPPLFSGGGIFIDGIRLPGVVQTTRPAGFAADPTGFAGGAFDSGPTAGGVAGSTAVPSGFLVGPTAGGGLTLADVNKIIQQSRDAAKLTRAAIRLPYTEPSRMIFAVGDANGNILAVYRQSDSTVFSLDVAVTKARNVAYFSGSAVAAQDQVGLPTGTAITNRTISFGSQRFFPSGLDFTGPGPYRNVFLTDATNPCSQGGQATNANHSGIVFFPGSLPLYKNGALVGGLGVSGDGVEQDDFVAAAGASGFEPPASIRADQNKIDGVRMPYLKFPRNPKNLGN